MTLIVLTTELALVTNALIHVICMIPVARMHNVKHLLIVLYVDVQVVGLVIHTQSAFNVGFFHN